MVLKGRAEKYRISNQAQQAILDYVEENGGYTINQTARSLKTNKSHTIGFVVPDLSNAFFAHLIAYLEDLCRSEDLVLISTSSTEDPRLEIIAIQRMLARGVDGLIIAPCSSESLKEGIKSLPDIPLVAVDRHYPSLNVPLISSDHRQSASMLTRKIVEKGCSRIAFLCGHPENPSIADRIHSFGAITREAGMSEEDAYILSAPSDSIAAGKELATELMEKSDNLPSAILCSSLLILEGALQQIKIRNGKFPADLVIGTFDYDGLLELLPNYVFAIQQDEERLAQSVFAILQAQMKQKKKIEEKQFIDTRLVCINQD
nr:substrate-binding domain-containing protein [uncultured Cohaesibacter sp.]